MCPDERSTLETLDALLASQTVRGHLQQVVERVTRRLAQQTAALMAWESLPLAIYGNALPPFIRSSWIFLCSEPERRSRASPEQVISG